MDYAEKSLELHYQWGGKLNISPKMSIDSKDALSLAYTPGVAAPCLEIHKDYDKSFLLSSRRNTVAVVTDGSAVLGLGNIGPEAAMPVMEGKCALFKAFADVDAVPLCIRSNDIDTIVQTVALLSGSFGGINLEDISAPRCFEIEQRLKDICDIPIFHDDQHGTAIVVLAALLNALKLLNKSFSDVKAVVSGAGAAGTAIVNLLFACGLRDIIVHSRRGILSSNADWLTPPQRLLASFTNPLNISGDLHDAIRGRDIFIGVSAANTLSPDLIRDMNPNPIIFALANPIPEIMPLDALRAGASIVGTGRSDFHNQINNVLAFPGVFRGALDARASDINEPMKISAAHAIANLAHDSLSPEHLLPEPFDPRIAPAVAAAVAAAARDSGVAR